MLDRLSYEEISMIAQFMDHKDIEKFRRASKVCNYAACFAIIKNLENFAQLLQTSDYLINQEYLKQNLPQKNIKDLVDFKVNFEKKNFQTYKLHIQNSSVKETLHLVMKLIDPKENKKQYEKYEFNLFLNKCESYGPYKFFLN